MEKREIWKIVIQTFITVLTAIGTSLGMLSCMWLQVTSDLKSLLQLLIIE